jgi:hypothetical protein
MINALDAVTKFDPRAASFLGISLPQFQALLCEARGARFVTVTTLTVPDMRKTNNPYIGRVKKVSRINGVVNFHYEHAVNRSLAKRGEEPSFIAQPRKWGVRLTGTPFVSHITKEGFHRLYLVMKVEKCIDHEYRYVDSGEMLTDSEVAEMRKFFPTRKQAEVIERDFDVRHILSIVIDSQGYVIVD